MDGKKAGKKLVRDSRGPGTRDWSVAKRWCGTGWLAKVGPGLVASFDVQHVCTFGITYSRIITHCMCRGIDAAVGPIFIPSIETDREAS
jgi:hypothetical protein